MSQESTILVNSHRRRCISQLPVRNGREVPEAVEAGRKSIRPRTLLKQRATGCRVSVVFTVGGPLVYQRPSDQFA
jgi:hypothetical protein